MNVCMVDIAFASHACIYGSEPMQNDQAYFLSDIFLKFYNIIK
jgi:hypothetical protein